MILPGSSGTNPGLLILECGLTGIAIASAFAWPRLASGMFARTKWAFARLARRKGLAVAVTGLSVIVLRPAMLP